MAFKVSMNWVEIKQLDQKRVRLLSLFLTTVLLFPLALWSFLFSGSDEVGVSIGNFGWPIANTVVFGVLLTENHNEDKFSSSKKDSGREFLCTIVLELFYFPELSLWGLLLCGLLLYVSVRELDSVNLDYHEIGMESPESFTTMFKKPICHILSEKKSRKIALFLLINTAYMLRSNNEEISEGVVGIFKAVIAKLQSQSVDSFSGTMCVDVVIPSLLHLPDERDGAAKAVSLLLADYCSKRINSFNLCGLADRDSVERW
ncbi:unnamed protein product [Thlaspi arvense]|uniref:Uncharacterized protein n=1 Tax=Thlaspi arvense TaxID=13288 RepID=A0AAU9TB07_THLAR|nr:unnamed protein product [Thlaspi arvense]